MTEMIESLFPEPVVTLEAAEEMWRGSLLPEEEACLSPRAVSKRRREFTAGRVCARAALERLGIRGFPLCAAPDRSPIWPPEIVGSLPHCGDWCGVAIARRGFIVGLGLDIERARPLEERVVSMVCSDEERAQIAAQPGLPPGLGAMMVFCAKESVYKCLYPLTGTFLDFHDVAITLGEEARIFSATIVKRTVQEGRAASHGIRSVRGRLAWDDAHVCAGAVLTAADLQAAVDSDV